jgi:ABC-type glycerol-3-phosphate transport system permease component
VALVVVILAAVWVLFPFYWAAITSLKQPVDVFQLSFIPWVQFTPTLSNWQAELEGRGSAIFGGLGNSFAIGVGASLVAMALGTLAARLDGAGTLQVLLRISLPLVAPTLVAAGIISFAFTWNEFLFAFVLTYSRAVPMSVLIAGTQDVMGVQFWYVSTRLLLAIVPPAVVALAVQRYVVQGLTLGAVKG